MLSPAEVANYHQNGQLTPKFRIDTATIGKTAHKVQALFNAHPKLDPDYAPSLIEMDKNWLDFAATPEMTSPPTSSTPVTCD